MRVWIYPQSHSIPVMRGITICVMLYISEYACEYGYFQCASGYDCFSEWEKCNGVLHCKDGSDEDPDVCKGIIFNIT